MQIREQNAANTNQNHQTPKNGKKIPKKNGKKIPKKIAALVIYYSDSIFILMISHVISYNHYNDHYSDHI
jgi:hypothetical protein